MSNKTVLDGAYVTGPDRLLRIAVLIGFVFLSMAIVSLSGYFLGNAFFEDSVFTKLLANSGLVVGLGLAIAMMKKYFFITNDSTGLFVTIDGLRSLRGKKQIQWYYGPGTHLCFPWERRVAENNISLKEATENLKFLIQLTDGTLEATGSFRLSPDENNPVRLLRGAGVIAQNLEDLIVSRTVAYFDKESLTDAMNDRKGLNDDLKDMLTKDYFINFQERFGVVINDVTISQLLPTEEVRRTMSARTEAEAIAHGTALLLGFSNKIKMNAALKNKMVSAEDISRARDRFLAVSGNMEGMNLDRKEISLSLSGLDPAVIQALTHFMQMPGIQAAAAAYAAKSGTNQQQGGRGNRGGKRQNRGGKPTQAAST